MTHIQRPPANPARFILAPLSLSSVFVKPGDDHFNGRLRDECLQETLFASLGHARSALRLWRDEYKHVRPIVVLAN